MSEFVHFVVEDLHGKRRIDDVRAVFEFMERQLHESDQETRDLIGWGFSRRCKMSLHTTRTAIRNMNSSSALHPNAYGERSRESGKVNPVSPT
jgi:hypothetical protein